MSQPLTILQNWRPAMKISGLQKLTLLDYPGHIAAIVFLPGCNFRCPFCQNSSLVLAPEKAPEISQEEFLRFLNKRAGVLEGICVTGGEPTLHTDLPELFRRIHEAGYLAKLDTNGTNPDMLEAMLAEGLLDYVAMDIKAGRDTYRKVCGLNILPPTDSSCCKPDSQSTNVSEFTYNPPDPLLAKINRSVDLLKSSGIDYEFRTTVVKGLHSEQDFHDIADWLSGSKAYYLQSFRDCPEVLQQHHSFSDFSEEEMRYFLEIVQKKIPAAALRGF